jgi:hypothetical protein
MGCHTHTRRVPPAVYLNAALTDRRILHTWCWHCRTYRAHTHAGDLRACLTCHSEYVTREHVHTHRRHPGGVS